MNLWLIPVSSWIQYINQVWFILVYEFIIVCFTTFTWAEVKPNCPIWMGPCRRGNLQTIEGLIPPGVLSYIRRQELYYKWEKMCKQWEKRKKDHGYKCLANNIKKNMDQVWKLTTWIPPTPTCAVCSTKNSESHQKLIFVVLKSWQVSKQNCFNVCFDATSIHKTNMLVVYIKPNMSRCTSQYAHIRDIHHFAERIHLLWNVIPFP
jgi:hypothetical protein